MDLDPDPGGPITYGSYGSGFGTGTRYPDISCIVSVLPVNIKKIYLRLPVLGHTYLYMKQKNVLYIHKENPVL
jgi:hypothetical protein